MKKETVDVNKQGGVYGRVWREKRLGRNAVIIISKTKEKNGNKNMCSTFTLTIYTLIHYIS